MGEGLEQGVCSWGGVAGKIVWPSERKLREALMRGGDVVAGQAMVSYRNVSFMEQEHERRTGVGPRHPYFR